MTQYRASIRQWFLPSPLNWPNPFHIRQAKICETCQNNFHFSSKILYMELSSDRVVRGWCLKVLGTQGYKIIFKTKELLLSWCAVRNAILTVDYLKKSRIIFVSLWFMYVDCCNLIVQWIVGVTKGLCRKQLQTGNWQWKEDSLEEITIMTLLLPWIEKNRRLFQNNKTFLYVKRENKVLYRWLANLIDACRLMSSRINNLYILLRPSCVYWWKV